MTDEPDPVEDLGDVPPEDLGEEGVLSPEELNVDDREEVRTIGDGRYVVSTEPGKEPSPRDRSAEPPTDTADSSATENVVSSASTQYATALAVKTDRGIADERFESNNIVDTFERTLRWYANRIDDSEPTEEVLRVLLEKSDIDL